MTSNHIPNIIVFDVNETLLDINTLTPLFTRLFNNQAVLREWFVNTVPVVQTIL